MGLNLDPRQRAMLQEMGVRVWWPRADPAAQAAALPAAGAQEVSEPPTPTPTAPVARQPVVAATTPLAAMPAPVPVLAHALAAPDGPVDALDWAQLARAVQTCTACALCEGRKAPVFVSEPTPAQAHWLVVGEPPDEQEERAGAPFAGMAGQLLDNMLRAVQCQRDGQGRSGARLTSVVKCRPAAVRPPQVAELDQCAVFLRREIALTQPRVILAMGRFAAMSLLGQAYPEVLQLPLGQLRGRAFRVQGIPVVVTYHPAKLLRAPQEKANAWADLCQARSLVDAAG
ncbi:MAG TPA: uracil-DNA glycosylase [Burkholderiaceae bacterium]|nr:uracil-DNA glycosylase [Burkholderiaceae bacterium]